MPTFPTISSGSMKINEGIALTPEDLEIVRTFNSGAMAMFPTILVDSWNTRVVRFLGDQEVRLVHGVAISGIPAGKRDADARVG